ncbi:unnamed protein product [Vitrella brassicaformis CCMP3155]|uniref:Uncharacterized protein n=1 Tax=Vitrella brassicaformis (strain CCMP3155) TaxID=1169540 RepID=A0A0G4H087_VITBC|nr:unnamed protein product [Vitrella brassicaformis CCMP3155]|eukprot:CEM36692.1 unnamed protein product [Vitrella brassicaformis CCMP3155]
MRLPGRLHEPSLCLVLRLDKCHAWIILLSAPIGTPAFVERTINEVVASHQRLLDAVVAFAVDDWDHAVQGANPLLRYCGSPHFIYWCRLLAPSSSLLAAARVHDAAKITAFTRIHRTGALSSPADRQVQLSIRLGDFGLMSSARIAPAAYLGLVAVTVGDVWDHFHGQPWMPESEASLLQLEWLVPAASARTGFSASLPYVAIPHIQQLIIRPQARLQQKLSKALAEKDFNTLFESFPAGSRDRCRLLTCLGPLSSGWLSAIPAYTRGDKRKCLNNYAYRLATALTFGLTFPLANLASSCPCGVAIDALEDHFFLYSRATAERMFKHNTLLDVFNAIFVEVGIPAATKVHLRSLDIVPSNAEPNIQRMDLFFTVDSEGGLCDVTVVHLCRPESSTPHHARVNRSHARQPGGTAAAGAERDRDRKYGNNCRQKGYTFVPLVVETFGCWGAQMLALLRRLARRRVPSPASSTEDPAVLPHASHGRCPDTAAGGAQTRTFACQERP